MVHSLAETDHVVVAGSTGHRCQVTRVVVKKSGSERTRSVAAIAILAGRQVRWRNHSNGIDAIVTGIAAHQRNGIRCMVHVCVHESFGIVTVATIHGGQNMVDRIGLRHCIYHVVCHVTGIAAL